MSLSYNTVTVFAGSESYGMEYDAQHLGRELGKRSVDVVCNGSGKGLAEEFFHSANSEGGSIVKLVAPELAEKRYYTRPNLSVLPVDGAAQRKQQMIARGEAIFVLPGGVTGEPDESVLTTKDLANGAGEKPLIILNLNGYFNGLRDDIAAGAPARSVHWARCVEEAMDIFDHMRVYPQPRA